MAGEFRRTMNAALKFAAISMTLCHWVSAQTVVLFESFEGNFPKDNDWTVTLSKATWGKVGSGFGGHGAAFGSGFAYCASVGPAGPRGVATYPADMDGAMERSIDLTGYRQATLSFWYMVPSIEDCFHTFGRCDYLSVQIDGREIYFDEVPRASWTPVTINLAPYANAKRRLKFEFVSDGFFGHEGAYLDNILVVAQRAVPEAVQVNDSQIDHASRNNQNEPSIVLGLGDTVLVAFNDEGSLDAATNKVTGWAVSTNGGQSFIDMGTLPSSPRGDLGDPVLARDSASGLIYLTTIQDPLGPGLQLFRSVDNGRSFLEPVNAAPGFAKGDQLDKPWLAVDNSPGVGVGNVYLVFRDFPSGQSGSQQPLIYSNVSTDHGVTWDASSTVLLGGGQGAYVVVGPQHDVYVFWWLSRRILMSKSQNYGQKFNSLATTVASLSSANVNGGLGIDVRTDSFPRAAVNPVSGDLYVVYNDAGVLTGDRGDIFITMSSDGGATWSPRHRVNIDSSANDQWFPCISVSPDGRNVFVGWYDRRLDLGNVQIATYGRFGTINGTNIMFGSDFRISDALFAPPESDFLGDYIQAVSDSRFTYFVWADARTGNADIRCVKIPIPDRFTGFSVEGDGAHIRLNTNPFGNYSVERSADLNTWTQVTNFIAGDFAVDFLDGFARGLRTGFYRSSVK